LERIVADARRAWAKALFLALPGADSRDRAAAALEGVASAMRDDAKVVDAFFRDPAIPKSVQGDAFSSLFAGGDKNDAAIFSRFARLIVKKGRMPLVPEIAAAFRDLLDRDRGVVRMDLCSARPLAGTSIEGIIGAWKKATGARDVVIRASQDPALLGGFILRTGSVRYDWSTAGRFKRLSQDLSRPLEADLE
jgi:F-type H+-transporting ATPase subunit delta